jgi:hypothetical protein
MLLAMLFSHAFDGGIFRVGCMGGWVGGGMGGGMGGWVVGGMGLRVGFIKINDMYNNDVGKGGVRVYEVYEVK